jgi:Protein of unknown function (DUF3631)
MNDDDKLDDGWSEAAREYHANRPRPPIAVQPKQKKAKAAKREKPRPILRVVETDDTPAEDGARLLDDVHAYLGRFVVYPTTQAHDAHALWIAHAHMMEAWDSTPRMAFLSPEPASGKTRALEVTAPLVPRPVEAINVSAAYLFRKIGGDDEGLPTVLFDEIDTVFGAKAQDNDDVRGLLNAGHRKGAVAGRCVGKGADVRTVDMPAYSALAVAGLGFLPDSLMTRAVIIRMRRRKADEKVEPFRLRLHGPAGEALKRRLEAWGAMTIGSVNMTATWPAMPAGIESRDADVWESLLAVADLAGGHWPERARVAAVTLVSVAKETQPSLGIKLLTDIKAVFEADDRPHIPTKVLIASLIALDEAPWGDLKGRPLDDRGLALRLRRFEIKPKTVRLDDTTTIKGYERSAFYDAWARYCPSPSGGGDSVTSVTSVTSEAKKDVPVTAVTDVTLPRTPRGDGRFLPSFPTKPKSERPNPPALGPPGDSLDDLE